MFASTKGETHMTQYRILTLDGGGLRGLITVILLQRLNATPGLKGWMDSIDLVAGTSTGGLLALAIAKGLDIQTLHDLYQKDGGKIFDDTWLDDVVDLGNVIGAQYSNRNLTRELISIIGNATLGDLPGHVLVTTFDLDNEDPDPLKRTWKPKIFHNLPGKDNDAGTLAYKAALYTTAAPSFFPSVDGYVDGGVFANNPSMCALAQTQDNRNTVCPPLAEVVLLSVGTGTPLTYIKGKSLNWGLAQWVKPLISVMMDGVGGIADYQCKQILEDRYHRLAPKFPPGVVIPLDAVKRIPEMIEFANNYPLEGTAAWMQAHWI
jgi:patatin-like phospholipase/acyl hydrolase